MRDEGKSAAELIGELETLHRRVRELEQIQTTAQSAKMSRDRLDDRYRCAVEGSPTAILTLDRQGAILSWNLTCERVFAYLAEQAIGQHFASLVLAKGPADFTSNVVKQVFEGKGLSGLELDCVSKDGRKVRVVAWAYPVFDDDQTVIECVLAGTHVVDQGPAQDEFAGELKKFQALYDVAVAMTAERTLDENLSMVVEKSREILAADTSYIALRDEGQREVYMRTLSGINTESFRKMRMPMGVGLGGQVAATATGRIIEDYFKETEPILHDIVRAEGLISGMAVPLQVGQTNLGVLYVFNRSKTRFSKSDLDTLSLMGNLAAVEISRKRAEEDLQRARDELEKRVDERTGDLTRANEKLIREIAERQKTQEALMRSERMLNKILSASPLGIAYIEDGRLRWTNQAMADMFGATSALDYMGKRPRDFYYSEDDYQKTRAEFLQRLKEGRQFEAEVRLKRYDGSVFYGQLRISALDATDPRKGTISTISDISDRKRAEEESRESEERYRSLVEESFDGIFVQDETQIVFANSRLYEMLGYSLGDLEEKDVWLLYHPDQRKLTRERILARLRGEKVPSQYEVKLLRKDGSSFDGEINARVVKLGNRPRVQVWVRDISERKQAEEALRASEEKYRTIIDNVEAVYYEVDLAGRCVFVTDAAYRILGHDKGSLLGKNFREFMKEEDAERILEPFKRVYKTKSSIKDHYMKFTTKDGTDRHLEISVSPMRDSEGNVSGFRGIARDVTERKLAEDEMIKLEKLESIGVLAGGIAHDFNNILTAIGGNISLAKMLVEPEGQVHKRLAEAEKAAIRARDLTQQLLTFSRGGAPIKRIASITGIITDACSFSLLGSNVICEFSIPDDLWSVEVDEAQIGQVFGNLVINADHAMPRGGVIQISADNLDVRSSQGLPLPQGKYVRVSITDHGIGIPQDVLPKVFDPYFTTKSDGSGLGLTTAYSIIKNHGGLLTVESQPGVGTTFHVSIPASEEGARVEIPSEDLVPNGTGRILVMDDDQAIRDLASELLAMLGYEAVTASDGKEALSLYHAAKNRGHPFDAVILDMTVRGGMGGREAYGKLVELDPQVKAIVSSGYSNDPIMADYEKYGFSGVVVKPYTVKELGETLRKVLAADN